MREVFKFVVLEAIKRRRHDGVTTRTGVITKLFHRIKMDDMLKVRAQKLKSRRDAVLIEVAGTKRMKELPAALPVSWTA